MQQKKVYLLHLEANFQKQAMEHHRNLFKNLKQASQQLASVFLRVNTSFVRVKASLETTGLF